MLIGDKDGTVIDTETRLMWQQATAPGAYTWEHALSYCKSLNFAGYSDWRLPTLKELFSIVDYSRLNPAINTNYFPDTVSDSYWSSTTYADGTSGAWGMSFGYGDDDCYYKSNSYYVRAVRGQIKEELC